MSKYLDAYVSAIPEGQRKAITSILSKFQLQGIVATRDQMEFYLQKLLGEMAKSGSYIVKPKIDLPDSTLAQVVESEMLNHNWMVLYAALYGLFEQMNRAGETIVRHRAVRESDFNRIKAAVNKLVEDVSIYQFLSSPNNDWSEAKFSNFWNARNANATIKAAEIDEQSKVLRCRIASSKRIHQLAGSARVHVTIEQASLGQASYLSRDFKPDNILDNDHNSFWAHLILADGPVTTVVDGATYSGAGVWVTLEFPTIENLATVRLLPFGAHPVMALAPKYWTGSEWADISGWVSSPASLDWQEYAFEQVQTNKIKFLLLQENFVSKTYLIPRRMFANALVWEMLVDQELLVGVEEEELTAAQKTAVDTNPRFRSLISGLNKFSERLGESGLSIDVDEAQDVNRTMDAAARVMTETREDDAGVVLRLLDPEDTEARELSANDTIEITKSEYLLGLFHVDLEFRNYFPVGIYESPQYDNQGVVYEVAVDTDEEHVQIAGRNLTSIEYEVELAPDRKQALLPYGTTRVPSELVKVDPNTKIGRLRFTPAGSPNLELRKDGVVDSNWSLSGRDLTITNGFSRNSIYTVSYDPLAGQDVLDLAALYDSRALRRPETFSGTDDEGKVTLTYYPFVAWEIINDDENWVRPDQEHARWVYRIDSGPVTIDGVVYGGGAGEVQYYEPLVVLVNGIAAKNLTDYRGRIHPAFIDSPAGALVYQYIHVGRKLYFNRPIEGGTIEVRYNWMTQYVKLLATLRGHRSVVNPYTAVLNSYRIRMKTSRL